MLDFAAFPTQELNITDIIGRWGMGENKGFSAFESSADLQIHCFLFDSISTQSDAAPVSSADAVFFPYTPDYTYRGACLVGAGGTKPFRTNRKTDALRFSTPIFC